MVVRLPGQMRPAESSAIPLSSSLGVPRAALSVPLCTWNQWTVTSSIDGRGVSRRGILIKHPAFVAHVPRAQAAERCARSYATSSCWRRPFERAARDSEGSRGNPG
uniref:Uncharacterized protein n=1 Tax=Rhipicephalus pulchellus TaxID=72859 RepID=L7M3U6_RHIPC